MTAPPSPVPRPNFLVVVLDCVRGLGLEADSPLLASMPFLGSIVRESITFNRAVTPAPWTVPAHASLLTGRYPWEHGLHARGNARLGPEIPRLPALLAAEGYRTLALSANPHLNDHFGLTEGFQSAGWGAWWEQYVRHVATDVPPGGFDRSQHPRVVSRLLGAATRSSVVRNLARWFLHHPRGLDGTNDLTFAFDRNPSACPHCVAEWIEPALNRWLDAQPAASPVFALVNLMEAHEPYLTAAPPRKPRSEPRSARVRQDFTAWFEGEWEPDPEQRRRLLALYRRSIQALDHRLEALVGALQRTDRWENTVLVVTGDHGQTFGDDGLMLHGMGLSEEITRIPLWLRLPGATHRGRRSDAWVSLVDVAPTVLELAGYRGAQPGPGELLPALVDEPRAGPVWSISEGMFGGWEYDELDPRRVAFLDRIQLAAYENDTKVVYDAASGTAEFYDFETRSGALRHRPDGATDEVVSSLRRVTKLAEAGPIRADGSVKSRLEAWGYL